ncbi:MAG: DNA-3-methyladenine glycosylase I [Planctomycetes bacterium]|nr:DNA-3-methyladenine glycosylase I [Planctomycetota bacterium]
MSKTTGCCWGNVSPMMRAYHDEEWGVPEHDDITLFEFLTLEGAQAGLSWETILRKRANYHRAFHGFDPRRIARYTHRDVVRLLSDEGIVRNRLKIRSTLVNATHFLEVQQEFGSFDRFIWQFVGGDPIRGLYDSLDQVPATTLDSDAMSRELKRRGFKFVGSTICYAYMQAVGMVNDHVRDCPRYDAC